MKNVELKNCSIATVDEGAGEPLLLVHGFPLDHTMWQPQIDFFREHHTNRFRVIAPDLFGFAESFPGDDKMPQTISMREYARQLVELLDALRITQPVTFCGLSMGGYIGWQMVRNHAERLRALVLCDTKATADSPEVARARHFMADGAAEAGTTVATRGMLERLVSSVTLETKKDVAAQLQRMIDRTVPAAVAAAQRGMAERADATELLPSITVPTLGICGADDQITPPSEMQAMCDSIPNADLEIIANAGHIPSMEQPNVTNDVLAEFLLQL